MEDSKEPGIEVTRRDLLKGVAVGGVGLLTGIGIGRRGKDRSEPEGTGSTEAKIFTSGETIETPVGKILIDGWRLLLDQAELQKRADLLDRTIGFKFIQPVSGEVREIFYSPGNKGEYQPRIVKGDREFLGISLFPIGENVVIFFEAQKGYDPRERRLDEEESAKIIPYLVRPKSYTSEGQGFLSAVDLGQDVFKQIDDLLMPFWPFVRGVRVLIHNSKDRFRDIRRNKATRTVYVPEDFFSDPGYKGEGYVALSHELAHDIVDSEAVEQEDLTLAFNLFQAYQRWGEVAKQELPKGASLQEIEENRLFSIFDESSYTKVEISEGDEGGGHPYSNFNELFASGFTVLKFFPDEFLARYKQLPQEEQIVVRDVVSAIYAILTQTERFKIKKDLPKLLPNQEIPQLLNINTT